MSAILPPAAQRVHNARLSCFTVMPRPLPTRPLPDYIRKNLRLLSIGINPGRMSSELGFAFAHPRNRFWPAFNAAGLVPETLTPSVAAVERLFHHYGIGFTDVVSRPTPQASDLTAADWRDGASKLRAKLERYQPGIAWFHGRLALHNFLRYGGFAMKPENWGLQSFRIGATRVFLSPSPSQANAAVRLETLIDNYRALRDLLEP